MEESPGSFQLYYGTGKYPVKPPQPGENCQPFTYTASSCPPAGLEPTWHRCVASRETNLATNWAIPAPNFCDWWSESFFHGWLETKILFLFYSEEANWSGSALFAIKYVNLYQQYGSSNLINWKLEMGMAS